MLGIINGLEQLYSMSSTDNERLQDRLIASREREDALRGLNDEAHARIDELLKQRDQLQEDVAALVRTLSPALPVESSDEPRYYLLFAYAGHAEVLSSYKTSQEAMGALTRMEACASGVDFGIMRANGQIVVYVRGRRRDTRAGSRCGEAGQ